MKYEVGDLVRLKSGSPLMVVAEVRSMVGTDYYVCHWFDKDDIAHSDKFHSETLTKGLVPNKAQE